MARTSRQLKAHVPDNAFLAFFADDEDVVVLEATLPEAPAGARLRKVTALAWQQRQRDTRRALILTDEAEALLAKEDLSAIERQGIAARLMLIRGEAKWLFGELEAGIALADSSVEGFTASNDVIGLADAHWLRAWIAFDQGDDARRDAEWKAMVAAAENYDPLRVTIARATLARVEAFRDVAVAQEVWSTVLIAESAELQPTAACAVEDFLAIVAALNSDYVESIRHFSKAYTLALASGQIRRAVLCATNIGDSFNNLNDHHAAVEWMQRGLDLARQRGWPAIMGAALMQTAETLRRLQRFDHAHDMLREALDLMSPMATSRNAAIAVNYLADVELDREQYASALENFQLLERRAVALSQADLLFAAFCGQAQALLHLRQPQPALQKAQSALAVAKSNADFQIAAFRVLADVHADYRLPPPTGMDAASSALHYLQRALALAATIEDYTIPSDLFEAVAREYAKLGDTGKAYEFSLKAIQAREKIHSTQASTRASAMQVSHETARARAEGEHHRQLAQTEALRAAALQEASATLETLGLIGREITAGLNAEAVFATLYRHVNLLLDATSLRIYLFEPDGKNLSGVFGIEAGKRSAVNRISIDDPTSFTARCAREQQDIVSDLPPDVDDPNFIPGTLRCLSLLFSPLSVGGRLLGVMTIQSIKAHAYGERERSIFRTLCAYGAIALDNAAAYGQVEATLKTLRETQTQLEQVSITDALTGLRNRRFLLQYIENDIAMILRQYDNPSASAAQSSAAEMDLIFFMLDIDHFKSINDIHGHAAGDMVLVQMRERLQEVFRESDYLIRWGGDELLLIARAANRADAAVVAERIRVAVSGRAFDLAEGEKLAATCSIGFACFPFLTMHPRLLSWSQVVELADQSLLMAKRGGRNGWIGLAGSESTPPENLFERLVGNPLQVAKTGDVQLLNGMHHAVREAIGKS